MPQTNFKDLLMVELPGNMNFRNITLKLFRTSQLLSIDTLPIYYPRGLLRHGSPFGCHPFQRFHHLCPDRHLDLYYLLYGGVEDNKNNIISVLSGLCVYGQTAIIYTVWAIWLNEAFARGTQAIR
ncbi:hypothetical protein AB4K20DRAFT_1979710 [Rhizopus microsporus]